MPDQTFRPPSRLPPRLPLRAPRAGGRQALMMGALLCGSALSGVAGAAGTPAGTVIRNTATFEDEAGSVRASADVVVAAVCAVELVPVQQAGRGLAGERLAAAWALRQVGNAPAVVRAQVRAQADQTAFAAARVQLAGPQGQVTGDPGAWLLTTLPADAEARLIFSAELLAAGSLGLVAEAGCAAEGVTVSAPGALEANLRPLSAVKAIVPDAGSRDGVLEPGEAVVYELVAHNPNAVAVSGAVLGDTLDAALEFVESSAPVQLEARAGATRLTWSLGTLGPGEERRVRLTLRVRAGVPDGREVSNVADLSAEQVSAVLSPPARFTVFGSRLLVDKDLLGSAMVMPGSLVDYRVTITNPSTVPLRSVKLLDERTLGASLEPLPSGALVELTQGGQTRALDVVTLPNGDFEGQTLERFEAGTFSLAGGQSVTLHYRLRVSLQGPPRVWNRVVASGLSEVSGAPVEVGSNEASRAVGVSRTQGRIGGDLAGRVYIDANANGRYDAGLDRPLAGARLLVAGGLEVMTDDRGRYSVRGLRSGRVALALDPSSVPSALVLVPGTGLRGAASVDLRGGVALQDFPLPGRPWQAEPRLRLGAGAGSAALVEVRRTPAGVQARLLSGVCALLQTPGLNAAGLNAAGPNVAGLVEAQRLEPVSGPAEASWQPLRWDPWIRPTLATAVDCGGTQ